MEIRRLKKGEEQVAYELSDSIFRNPRQKSMGAAFPSIFFPDLIHQSYGGFVDGELVAFFGLVPSIIRVGEARLNVYSIGSVCTDPNHRGQGYAAAVLDQILEDLKQTEASLLLVSGDRSLYTRVGCQHFGEVISFEIESASLGAKPNHVVRAMTPADLHAMTRLANRRSVAYEQLPQDLAMLIQAEAYASCLNRTHKVKVLEVEGELRAFLVAGLPFEGLDVQDGLGIEWAGKSEDVAELVQAFIDEERLTHFTLPVPWHEADLLDQFCKSRAAIDKNQGTVYLINPARLIEQVQPFYEKNEAISFSVNGENVEWAKDGERVRLSPSEFIKLVLDPKEEGNREWTLPFPYTAGLNYI